MTCKSLFIFALLLFAAMPVFSDNVTNQQKGRVFTDDDLNKYRKSPDVVQPPKKNEAVEKKRNFREKNEEVEKEYWCKKENELTRLVDKARDDVRHEEDKLERAKTAYSTKRSDRNKKSHEQHLNRLQNNIEKAKNRLKHSERNLQDLENEAHRKNIPPGWLRCQFTY